MKNATVIVFEQHHQIVPMKSTKLLATQVPLLATSESAVPWLFRNCHVKGLDPTPGGQLVHEAQSTSSQSAAENSSLPGQLYSLNEVDSQNMFYDIFLRVVSSVSVKLHPSKCFIKSTFILGMASSYQGSCWGWAASTPKTGVAQLDAKAKALNGSSGEQHHCTQFHCHAPQQLFLKAGLLVNMEVPKNNGPR